MTSVRWIKYWRESLVDGSSLKPDWSKYESAKVSSTKDFLFLDRREWVSGKIGDGKLYGPLFSEVPDDIPAIQVFGFPSVFSLRVQHARRLRNGKPQTFHTLAVKAKLSREGYLSSISVDQVVVFPTINRKVLDPLDPDESHFVVGHVDQQDEYLSAHRCPAPWDEFLEYAHGLESAAVDPSFLSEYRPWDHVVVVPAESSIDYIGNLVALLDNALSEPPDAPLFDRICEGAPRTTGGPSAFSEQGKRLGHMHPSHPLADAQRDALTACVALRPGEVQAIIGPPGTGKTTLLQSVVASYWVAPLLEEGPTPTPPILVACSTNNQAVTNIIESFRTVAASFDGDLLSQRWIPDWSSFGTYLANQRKDMPPEFKSVIKDQVDRLEISASLDCKEVESYFSDRFKQQFPERRWTTLKDATTHLRDMVRYRAALLTTLPRLLQFSIDASSRLGSAADFKVKVADSQARVHKSEKEYELLEESKIELITHEANEPWYFMFADYLKPIRAKRQQRQIRFLKAQGILPMFKQYMNGKSWDANLDIHAFLAQSSSRAEKDVESSVSAHRALLKIQRDAAEAQNDWVKKCKEAGIAYELTEGKLTTPEDLDRIMDTKVRQPLFLLATHYWEARWITEIKHLTPRLMTIVPDKDMLDDVSTFSRAIKTLGDNTPAAYRRRAMISPIFVSTFHSLPKSFSKVSWHDGPSKLDPYWGCIDLLIVDEGGQVSPEVGAAGFLMAKKSVVVGDPQQIQPVRSVAELVDRGNAALYGVCITSARATISASNDSELSKPEFLNEVMAASSGSLVEIAARASVYCNNLSLGRGIHLYEHRRCDDEIISFCNSLCYQGTLKPMRGSARRPEFETMHLPALGFVRVPGKEVRPLSGSLCNPIEARAIASWIHTHHDRLVEHYKSIGGPETIENIVAVVTPYALQKTEIKTSLKDLGVMAPITVGTVHALQGAERPVVLFSAVNSKESSPHVRTKPSENSRGSRPRAFWDRQSNILNVAVSRAKDSFILFSDMSHFKPDDVGSPSGTLAKILDEKEDSEISFDLTSAISKAISKSYPVHEMQGVTIKSVSTLEDHRSVLARAFDQGLGARSEVILTSPWIERAALDADAILDLVRSATSRGVVVRIFTDRTSNNKRDPGAFQINVKSLRDAGATVEVVSRLHCKVLFVDDWLKCVGSFNWLSASRVRYFSQREVSTLVEGAAFVAGDKKAELEALEGLIRV